MCKFTRRVGAFARWIDSASVAKLGARDYLGGMSIESAWDNVPAFTIGDYLRKAREHAGLEQTELASEIGISRGTVTNYERGHVTPRKAVVMAWAMRTGVPVEWITSLGKTKPRPDSPDGAAVRHQGLEPRTHWFGADDARVIELHAAA